MDELYIMIMCMTISLFYTVFCFDQCLHSISFSTVLFSTFLTDYMHSTHLRVYNYYLILFLFQSKIFYFNCNI